MSASDRLILPVVDPTIRVDPIYMEDTETGAVNPAVPPDVLPNTSAKAGAWVPIVAVRTILFGADEIRSMNLSFSARIPRLSLTVKDRLQKFTVNFPLDGDVVSVYLRPPDKDNQRPIRMDFDIMTVSSSPVQQTYTFSCILKVPGMFGEVCRSFGNGTTFDHLSSVAADLGLGFASNESGTSDSMRRLCAYESYETFIQNTVRSAYKDDDSFFTWYVDPFYYLCLVNVNKQFSEEDATEDVNVSYAIPFAGVQAQDEAADTIRGSLVLTNKPEMEGMNTYIESYSLENSSADVWIRNGYKRAAQYYETGTSPEYVQAFVDPLTTPGAERDKILLKGRPDESIYKSVVKHKWMGKQHPVTDSGNVHDNYLFASLLNHQNMEEISKVTLKVHLAGMNFYISKWGRVPVLIYSPGQNFKNSALLQKRDADLGEDGEPDPNSQQPMNAMSPGSPSSQGDGRSPGDWVKNEFVSGYYVVSGIDYRYAPPGPVKQVLTLVRREWPIPARNKDV